MDSRLETLQRRIGHRFGDPRLLTRALTHRSFGADHNERLEFLGDAVLELVVTEYLYSNFQEPEGILTNWRSALVRTESISAAAARMGYEPLLRLSRGEKRGTERARAQILANTFEATIGAVYVDQGYDAAKQVIEKQILTTFQDILASGSWLDPKSRLQELSQSSVGFTPIYRVMQEDGPDHDKTFTVGAYIDDRLFGKGVGPSKQAAQQQAAEKALAKFMK